MSRSRLIGAVGAVALAALSGASAAAADAGTGTATPGPGVGGIPALSATVEQCVTAATQSGRSVTFAGQMETVAGAHELSVQIVVQQRTFGEEGFHTITTGGLGTWQHSEPGVGIYKVRQAVTDLPAPALYRAIVRYRWLDEHGQVIRRDKRRTPVCRQPLERHRPGTGSTATMPKA